MITAKIRCDKANQKQVLFRYLSDHKREIVRSCHFTKEVKIFCENLELFGPYLAFLTKMSGNTSSITTKCKQTEEINILKITFDEFFNFSQLQNFDFCGGSPWQKSKQIWTQKVKIHFSIS